MQRFPHTVWAIPAAACIGLFLSAAGCAESRYATVKPSPGASLSAEAYSGPVRADLRAAYDACLARCNENSSLGAVTREGCFKGCAEVRRRVNLRDEDFASRQECSDALREVDINRDLYIEDMRRWCDSQWEHLHKRKGCYDAVAVFYNNLTEASVCGGGYAQPPNYTQAQQYDRATGATATPIHAAPAVQPAPAAPAYSAAATTPYLQDTPKYQKNYRSGKKAAAAPAGAGKSGSKPAAKAGSAAKGKPGKASAAAPKPVEKDAPMPGRDQAPPPTASAVTPSATAPQQADIPTTPGTALPAQSAPAAPAALAPVPAMPSPAAAPKMSDGPTLRVPDQGGSPAAPVAAPVPQQAAPSAAPAAQAQPPAAPGTASPSQAQPPAAQASPAAAATPPASGVIPPVPSMLEQPYNLPTLIAPQAESEK